MIGNESEAEILEKLILDPTAPLDYVSPSMQSKLNSWLESIQSPSYQCSLETGPPPSSPTRPSDLYSRFGGLSAQNSNRSVDDITIPFSSFNKEQETLSIGLPSPTLRRYTTYPDVFRNEEASPLAPSNDGGIPNGTPFDPPETLAHSKEYADLRYEIIKLRELVELQTKEFSEYRCKMNAELEDLRSKNQEVLALLEKKASFDDANPNNPSPKDTQESFFDSKSASDSAKLKSSRHPPVPRPLTDHKVTSKTDSPLISHQRFKIPEENYPIGFCKHFKNGVCALGDKCKDLHISKINERPSASPKINSVKRIIQSAVANHSSSTFHK